jgi:hypothetical protein
VCLFTPVVTLLNSVSPVVSLPLRVCNLTPVRSPVGPAPKRVKSISDTTVLALVLAVDSNRTSKVVVPIERAGGSILPLNVAPLTIKLPVNCAPLCVFTLNASTSNSPFLPWSVTLKSPPVKLAAPDTFSEPDIV